MFEKWKFLLYAGIILINLSHFVGNNKINAFIVYGVQVFCTCTVCISESVVYFIRVFGVHVCWHGVYVCTYAYICMCTCVHAYMYAYMCVCMCGCGCGCFNSITKAVL